MTLGSFTLLLRPSVLFIFRTFLPSQTETLYPLNTDPPAPHHHSTALNLMTLDDSGLRIQFLLKAGKHSIAGLYNILCILSSVIGHFGCSYILAVVNNAAVNMGGPVFAQDCAFSSSECIPRKLNFYTIC